MKTTAIDSSVLGGQGCIGSSVFKVANPAPGVGPASGADGDLSTQIASPEATTGAAMPAMYPLSGPTNEPDSQYDTIDPIPKG
jgi:hypothetical protein